MCSKIIVGALITLITLISLHNNNVQVEKNEMPRFRYVRDFKVKPKQYFILCFFPAFIFFDNL